MKTINKILEIIYKDTQAKYADETAGSFVEIVNDTVKAIYSIDNLPEEEQCKRLHEIIYDATKTDNNNYRYDLLSEMLRLQHEFYVRNINLDDDKYTLYKYMMLNPQEYYKHIVQYGDEHSITLEFKMNPFAPTRMTLNDLETFKKSVKKLLKCYHHIGLSDENISVAGVTPVILFCRDIAGSNKSWANKIANWNKCLKIYDWHYAEQVSKTEITKRLGTFIEADNSNPLSEVREALDEAIRLIQSAKNGTFPI